MYLPQLVKLIAPFVDKLTIYNDILMRGRGEMDKEVKVINRWNLRRALKEQFDNAEEDEPVLFCCDDMTTTEDWYDRFMKLHKECNHDHYQFFTRLSRLFTTENMNRGYIKGTQGNGFYDAAFVMINRKGMTERIDVWFDRIGRHKYKKRNAHYDNIIQDFLIHYDYPWVLTIPTLFEHIGEISSLGHKIGRSPKYVGDTE